ncbi:hypothetical protein EDC01DRAFT_323549 [Geopyxis carbonaria]|nr:hypothetical protein EDC01DRAFT_323549 [Geopyxis carbonaria]
MPALTSHLGLAARSLLLLARAPQDPPLEASHPSKTHMGTHSKSNSSSGGLSGGAIAAIVILVLLFIGGIAYVIYTVLRARRLGLPSPTWRTFVPFLARNRRTTAAAHTYEPTRPTGGVLGRVKTVFGGTAGGYSGTQTRSTRTRNAALDPDQAWDTRIEEEEELGYRGAAGVGGNRYDGYDAPVEMERGRSRSRDPPRAPVAASTPYPADDHAIPSGPNPFDRDVARVKSDGFGDVGIRGGRGSTDSERRSVFKEGI